MLPMPWQPRGTSFVFPLPNCSPPSFLLSSLFSHLSHPHSFSLVNYERDHTNVGMWKAASFLSLIFRIFLSDSPPSVNHAGFVCFWPVLLCYSELCLYGPQKVFSYCALCFRWKLKTLIFYGLEHHSLPPSLVSTDTMIVDARPWLWV